ncbi:uncharacterized protein LOC111083949 [Limulus polyphemus]|uniref:Uncharacterized protein LOC111083949 n=1 Tax=Limulus polyphemus TaxID=6850 RepID=A0ABM1RYF9_LIMPO|nr:uncharacterized protein LOC111083949 [Limulus polyphemus]
MSFDTNNCKLLSELKKVLKNIKLDSNETKTNNAIVNAVLQEIICRMKRLDTLFNVVYQRLVYTGSYYQGLRLHEATEYDVNLVLQFPFRKEAWSIETEDSAPSFVKCKLIDSISGPTENATRNLSRFFDEEKYLTRESVIRWLQSLIDKVLKGCLQIKNVKKVRNANLIAL